MSLWKTILIVIVILIMGLGIVVSIFYFSVKPELKINGEEKVVLNLGDEYKEDGIKAFILNKDVSSDVIVNGNVNTI